MNLCLEPLLGALLRRGLLLRGCTVYGDHVLPVLLRCAQLECQYVTDWTGELARLLVSSPEYGAHNTAVLGGWLDRWLPPVRAAAAALRPLVETAALPLDHAAALAAAEENAAVVCQVIRKPAGGGGMTGLGGYDYVGIIMTRSEEGDAVADVCRGRDDVEVIEEASFWDIRAKDRLVICYDEVSDQLGSPIDGYAIQHEMSTHYGRLVATDDALMVFSDPVEAMEYLSR